jgi:hypothetical protein
MVKDFENTCPTLWTFFGILLNSTGVKHMAESMNKQDDYWTEITYHGDELIRPGSETQESQTVSETLADMPDEDWGDDLVEEDWVEIESSGLGATEKVATEGKADVWSTNAGTPWKKRSGAGFRRQLERTKLVSYSSA